MAGEYLDLLKNSTLGGQADQEPFSKDDLERFLLTWPVYGAE